MVQKNATVDPRLVRADAEETEDEKKAREDAEKNLATAIPDASSIMDALKSCMDSMESMGKRMDAMEDARKDAARRDGEESEEDKKKREDAEKADAARRDAAKKDGEEEAAEPVRPAADRRKDEEREREDAARSDAVDVKEMRRQMDAMGETIRTLHLRNPAPLAAEDARLVAEAQARADDFLGQMGERAPRPQIGEDAMSYRRRVLRDYRQHSPALKEVNLYGVTDEAGFAVIEERIYADAIAYHNDPARIPAGRLRRVEKPDKAGHMMVEYHGEPRTWMDPMAGAATHKVQGSWGD